LGIELLMSILKYGTKVKVIAPATLVKKVREEIEAMQQLY